MHAKPFIATLLVLATASAAHAADPVTISEDARTWTLDNGIVQVMVAKESGDMVSMRFKNMEMLGTFLTPEGKPDLQRDPPGHNPNGLNRGFTDHQYFFWSHDAMGPRGTGDAIAKVTIDPKTNNGQRAEVSVKGISKGRMMGTGPGAQQTGQFASDIEIRFTLNQGESGVYTYCIFEHPEDYPTTSLGEARFCAKLADMFDWMSAGEKYNRMYTKEQARGEDKYSYTTVQSQTPAFGWSSSTKNVGFYCINPSMEYMSGGPTKPEFLGHRDTNQVYAPCVLNYWRSSHYGGAAVDVAQGERWKKVIGPAFLYVNSGANPQAMYDDAKAQATKEIGKWPFDWVKVDDYATKEQRTTVKGRLNLKDAQATNAKLPNLQVGLTHAPWQVPTVAGRGPAPARVIDWQQDAKYYQFWAKGQEDGTFSIPFVQAGTYTLRAFADGVLGEFARADVKVESGKPLDLGSIDWTPVRKGKQLWDVGIPNRNGSEYFKAEDYALLDLPLQYPKLFPNDVVYTIGKSDFRKDWFYAHVPHNTDPNARAVPFSGIQSASSKSTPYSIVFDMPSAGKGRATLRAAISGTGARSVQVTLNDQPIGTLGNLPADGAITRHQIQGIWVEREVAFDGTLLKPGSNTLKLIVAGGGTPPANPAIAQAPAAAAPPTPAAPATPANNAGAGGGGTPGPAGAPGANPGRGIPGAGPGRGPGRGPAPAGGNVNNGVIYDYLRLELDEAAQ